MANPFDRDESTQATASAETAAGEAPRAETDPPGAGTDPLTELQRERDALQDRLLRTAAEFDNYRKRIERERRDQAGALAADTIEELLPIIDNLERALDAPVGSDAEVYRTGVQLIHRQMTELLHRRGVKPIQTEGADFDPRFHQAVIHEVSAEHREGEVMGELRRGYMLGERLLRPAMVKVAKA